MPCTPEMFSVALLTWSAPSLRSVRSCATVLFASSAAGVGGVPTAFRLSTRVCVAVSACFAELESPDLDGWLWICVAIDFTVDFQVTSGAHTLFARAVRCDDALAVVVLLLLLFEPHPATRTTTATRKAHLTMRLLTCFAPTTTSSK